MKGFQFFNTKEAMAGKVLLVVNTGWIKKRFIFQRIKKLGIIIVCLNKEKNWAQPYVDHWILTDTYHLTESVQAIKDFLNTHPKIKLDGAITFWEDDIPLLAKICEELKLTGNSDITATNTRNKYKMREVLNSCGVSPVPHYLLRSKNDLNEAIKKIGFPAVIKPVYGANSEFVVLVNDRAEAVDAYAYIYKNCTPAFDPIYHYNKNLFVYEEYVQGQEFSLECFVQHGVPHVVGIHEKTAMENPFFVETGDYIPPRVSDAVRDKLVKTAEAALIVLGVKYSLGHVELKLSEKGIRIIEVASRLGGDYTYQAVLHAHGADLVRIGCEIALNINVEDSPLSNPKFVMGRYFIPKTSGVITQLSGIEELKKNNGIIDSMIFKKVGDSILLPPDGYETIGWVLVGGSSYAEVEKRMAQVFEEVDIEVVPFKSMSSVGKTSRKNRFSSALLTPGGAISKVERLRRVSIKNQRQLHIGVACNVYDDASAVEADLMSVGLNIEKTLKKRGYKVTFFDFNDVSKAFADLKQTDVDLVFNVCERINDSSLLEPHAASILDTLQIPYTGSNPFTLALCIDKIRVKKLLTYHSIPTPKWDYIYTLEDEIDDELKYPLIVKPGNTDNSIGITNESVVSNKEELDRQLKKVVGELGRPALVEEYIEGDEYDVVILGSEPDDVRVLPLSRSVFDGMPSGYWHIFPFDAKWKDQSVYSKIKTQRPPKNVSKRLLSLITEIALDTYNILDCHDYGRVEIRVDKNNNPYILELNPNPSINVEDAVPACAELTGMDYGDFLEDIITMAIKRYKNRAPYDHLQTNMI